MLRKARDGAVRSISAPEFRLWSRFVNFLRNVLWVVSFTEELIHASSRAACFVSSAADLYHMN